MTDILTVLVGSRAHGLHNEDSDFDWRGVFVNPTRDLFKVFPDAKQISWEEGHEDNTKWEIQRFLQLAVKCNPTILEVFAAPLHPDIAKSNGWGHQLRDLFQYIWEPKQVAEAFIGYGLNQRKKFFDNKDGRRDKFAVAYARTLLQAYHLLTTRVLHVNMEPIPGFDKLRKFRSGDYKMGELIDFCMFYQGLVEDAAAHCNHKPDLTQVDQFLSDLRISYLQPR